MASTDSQDKYIVSFSSDTSDSESDSEDEPSGQLEKDTRRPGGLAAGASADTVTQNGRAGGDLDGEEAARIRLKSDLQSSTCVSGTEFQEPAQSSAARDFGKKHESLSPGAETLQSHLDREEKGKVKDRAKSSSNGHCNETSDLSPLAGGQQQQQQEGITRGQPPKTFTTNAREEATVEKDGAEMETYTTNGVGGLAHEGPEPKEPGVENKKESAVVNSSGGALTNGVHATCNGFVHDAAGTGEVGAPLPRVGARISSPGLDQNGLAGLEGSRALAKRWEAPDLQTSAGNDVPSSTEPSFSPANSSGGGRSSSDVEARARKFLLATAPLAAACTPDDQAYTAATVADVTGGKQRVSESGKLEAEAQVGVVLTGQSAPVSDILSSSSSTLSSAGEWKQSAVGKVTQSGCQQQQPDAQRTELSQSVHIACERPVLAGHTESKMEEAEDKATPTSDENAVVGEPLGEVHVKLGTLDAEESSEPLFQKGALKSDAGDENDATFYVKVENGTEEEAAALSVDKSSAAPAPDAEARSSEEFPNYDRKSTDDLIRRILEEARGLGKAPSNAGSRYKVDMGDNTQVDDFGTGHYDQSLAEREQPSLLDRRLAAMRQVRHKASYLNDDQDMDEEVNYRSGRGWPQRRHMSDTTEYGTDYGTEFLGTDYRPGMYASADYRYNDPRQLAIESDVRASGFRQRPSSSWRKKQQAFDDDDGDFLMEYSGAGSGGRMAALARYGREAEEGADDDPDVFDESRQQPEVPFITDEDFVPQRREETDEVIKEKTTEVRGMVERQSDVIKELKRASKSFDELNDEIRELRQSLIENEIRRSQMEEDIVVCDREFKEAKKQQVDLGARKYAPPGYDYTADFLSEYKPTYGRTSKLSSQLEVSASSAYTSRSRSKGTDESDPYLSGYRKPGLGSVSYRSRSQSLYDDFGQLDFDSSLGPGEGEDGERRRLTRGKYGNYGEEDTSRRGKYGTYGNDEEAPPASRYGRYGNEDKPSRGKYGNYGEDDASSRGRYGAYSASASSYGNSRYDSSYDNDRSSRLSRLSRSATVAPDYGSAIHRPTYHDPQPAPTTSRFLKKVRDRKASGAENAGPKRDKPFQSRFLRKASVDSNISSSSSMSFTTSSTGGEVPSNSAVSEDKPSTAKSVETPGESKSNSAEAAAN